MTPANTATMSPAGSVYLDTLRWGSALLVLFTHINNRMFVSYTDAVERSPIFFAWTFICGFAHPAVVVFFVLSGYLVGGPLLKRTLAGQHGVSRRYFVDRFARIYLVLIPVIAITFLADAIGWNFDLMEVYSGFDYSAAALWGTALNVQNLVTPFFGSNGPLGTLANEWWYYLTAPFLLLALNRSAPLWMRTLLPAMALLLSIWFTMKWNWHGVGLLIWLVGAAAYCMPRPPLSVPSVLVLVAAVFLGVRVGLRSEALEIWWINLIVDLTQGAAIALLLMRVRLSDQKIPTPLARSATFGASFSYSLYAVHVPLVTLGCVLLDAHLGFGWNSQPTIGRLIAALGMAAAVLCLAWALSLITERHTHFVRTKLYRTFNVPQRAQPPTVLG